MQQWKNKNKCPHCGHELCLRTDETLSWDILEDGRVSTNNHSVARSRAYIHCGGCSRTSLDDNQLLEISKTLNIQKRFID